MAPIGTKLSPKKSLEISPVCTKIVHKCVLHFIKIFLCRENVLIVCYNWSYNSINPTSILTFIWTHLTSVPFIMTNNSPRHNGWRDIPLCIMGLQFPSRGLKNWLLCLLAGILLDSLDGVQNISCFLSEVSPAHLKVTAEDLFRRPPPCGTVGRFGVTVACFSHHEFRDGSVCLFSS